MSDDRFAKVIVKQRREIEDLKRILANLSPEERVCAEKERKIIGLEREILECGATYSAKRGQRRVEYTTICKEHSGLLMNCEPLRPHLKKLSKRGEIVYD